METVSRLVFIAPLLRRVRQVYTRAMIGVSFDSLAPTELIDELVSGGQCTPNLLVEEFERANIMARNPLGKADANLWPALKIHLDSLDDLRRIFEELLLFSRGLSKLQS